MDFSVLWTSSQLQTLGKKLEDAVAFLAGKGWCPATSSNFSFRIGKEILAPLGIDLPYAVCISRSGADKQNFRWPHDVLICHPKGDLLSPENVKSSAETAIHLYLYETKPEVNAILHTHSSSATVLSMRHKREASLQFCGYELQKGLAGIESHEGETRVPIFANDQTMDRLTETLRAYEVTQCLTHGFLLAGHGLYAFGQDIFSARRHIETFEFLFQCRLLEHSLRSME